MPEFRYRLWSILLLPESCKKSSRLASSAIDLSRIQQLAAKRTASWKVNWFVGRLGSFYPFNQEKDGRSLWTSSPQLITLWTPWAWSLKAEGWLLCRPNLFSSERNSSSVGHSRSIIDQASYSNQEIRSTSLKTTARSSHPETVSLTKSLTPSNAKRPRYDPLLY